MAKRNTIKQKELSEEVQEEMSDALEEKVEETQDFLKTFFSQKKISSLLVARNLPFVAFLALLDCCTSRIATWQRTRLEGLISWGGK
ncbi:Uncharacterised protein [Sphingobacterium daejeonense]|nr:Uncharacterised protein [Sphingobacterium daejeonense]